MSKNPANPISQKKKVASALERIEQIENTLPQVIAGVNQAFSNVDQNIGTMKEILDALVELTGADQVNAAIAANRAKQDAERAEAMKKKVEEAVAQGALVVVEKVGENTLVVGKETDKDGNLVGAGRLQMHIAGIKPEFKEKLLGQGLGTKLELPTGGSFEVTEIYDFVEKKDEETGAESAPAPEEA